MKTIRTIWLRAILTLMMCIGTVGASVAHAPPELDATAFYIGPDGLPGVFCLTSDDPEGMQISHPCDACLLVGVAAMPGSVQGPERIISGLTVKTAIRTVIPPHSVSSFGPPVRGPPVLV